MTARSPASSRTPSGHDRSPRTDGGRKGPAGRTPPPHRAADPPPPRGIEANGPLMALVACVLPMALVLIGLRVPGIADFAQWDNLEAYLPWILSAHRRLLGGEFPLWNQHQNLGEPLHAMGAGGALYLPYTFCTWLVDLLRWDPRSLLNTIAVTHIGFAGLGLYRLCRSFGVRPLFAATAAISGAMSGFGLLVGGLWIHVLPILAWSAWALCGVKELIDFRRPARAACIAIAALWMAFAVGHIQAAIYLWLFTGLFAIAYAAQQRRLRASAPWLVAVSLAAALLSMPSVLPSAALLPDSNRTEPISREEFGRRGVSLLALQGLLLPSYGGVDGFLEANSFASTHAGAWLVPVLIAACAISMLRPRRRRGRDARLENSGNGPALVGGLALNAALAAVVVVLSLGNSTPVYGWTYGIPVWSSFRWPFKHFQHALPFLMVSGAIALERLALHPASRSRRLFFPAAGVAALLAWSAAPGLQTPSAVATGVCGVLAMIALTWLDVPWGRALLVLAVVLEAEGMMLVTHRPDRHKTYTNERVGQFGLDELGISPDYRLLPLSTPERPGEVMQELGLFHSATLCDYYSLTGHRMALTSQRLWTSLPTNFDGVLPGGVASTFLQSHLMRSFNGRYALAAKHDSAMVGLLRELPGYRQIAETPRAVVFANQDALPRFYFATEVREFKLADLRSTLIENRGAPTTAFVQGPLARAGTVPPGRVQRSTWDQNQVSAEIAAAAGGFLVVSMCYSPDWVARVDGRPAELRITNGTIMGLDIPPGATQVVLRYDPPSFRLGLWLGLLGVVLWAAVVIGLIRRPGLGARNSRSSVGAETAP